MKKIKVLMLVANLRKSNGVASYVINYFNAINKNKIQMDFVLLSDIDTPYYQNIVDGGSHYYILPKLSKPLALYKKCKQIIVDGEYDIIHDNILLPSLPMMLIAKKKKVPVRILHSHNSRLGETIKKEKRNKFLLPLLLWTSTVYFACSNKAATTMFKNEPYYFIPNIISGKDLCFSSKKREDLREKMLVEDKIVIGTVGRIAAQKNPLFALEVINSLVQEMPKVEYWWIGSGPMDEEVKRTIKELGLTDKVKMFGSRDDVPELYQAMDVFFLPSLFEGLPVTGVEAQAMGLPSVVSNTVTNELVFTDLVKFVSLDDPIDEWVKALCEQISRIPYRRSYNEELQSSCFSEQSAGEFLEQLYLRLLSD